MGIVVSGLILILFRYTDAVAIMWAPVGKVNAGDDGP